MSETPEQMTATKQQSKIALAMYRDGHGSLADLAIAVDDSQAIIDHLTAQVAEQQREIERLREGWDEAVRPVGLQQIDHALPSYACDCLPADPVTGRPSGEDDALYAMRQCVLLDDVAPLQDKLRAVEALKAELFTMSNTRTAEGLAYLSAAAKLTAILTPQEGA